MYYYLYKITNCLNGKIYIGVHQTNNLDDGYFGSGLALHRAIKKYGKENFLKEIIEYFNCEASMFLREKEIVDSNFVKSSNHYNIVEGGHGSFSYINSLPNQGHASGQQIIAAKAAGNKHRERMQFDSVYRESHSAKNSQSQQARWRAGRSGNTKGSIGSIVWISNFDLCRSYCIPFSLYPAYYEQGWVKGRKFHSYNLNRNLYKKRN